LSRPTAELLRTDRDRGHASQRFQQALRAAPVAITVKDPRGAALYTNTTPGLTPALTTIRWYRLTRS
jgi:hypothetical protein